MPEGHVTHRISGELNREFGGREVRSTSPQGKFTGAELVDGRTFDTAQAYGKHMYLAFEDVPEQVHIHLGLIGKFFFFPEADPPTENARWRLTTFAPDTTMELRGPNVCELSSPEQIAETISKLGPDPLREDADPEVARARIRRSSSPIGVLMMDQKIFAGVGNIYRAETLYRHHIDPFMAGKFLRGTEFDLLWDDLVELMPLGVRDGRIDTVYPEHTPEAMGRDPRVDKHGGEVYVYRRAGQECLVCGTPVSTKILTGRNLFWCKTCQPRSRRRTIRD
ncbi:formamidopyrimidine-DNA glycosylase [Flexivirga endophytica]|uniref:DNA-(apurinic or apyrimidinic site) lyase n=1 Tax=Flexivirga endophytica TaxID=1849103 RepID=A0A916T4F8_9MICO|nr:Fpg/Nei family DNA glycosylase [Flexivirga endophytica]GGB28941.1 formamidopyrimidine-DNA glycosylase [Flexivirga endophytica]GHB49983.1 formamidopyrimidine-DNA glycosylase [Flexivirga endophytica]